MKYTVIEATPETVIYVELELVLNRLVFVVYTRGNTSLLALFYADRGLRYETASNSRHKVILILQMLFEFV